MNLMRFYGMVCEVCVVFDVWVVEVSDFFWWWFIEGVWIELGYGGVVYDCDVVWYFEVLLMYEWWLESSCLMCRSIWIREKCKNKLFWGVELVFKKFKKDGDGLVCVIGWRRFWGVSVGRCWNKVKVIRFGIFKFVKCIVYL